MEMQINRNSNFWVIDTTAIHSHTHDLMPQTDVLLFKDFWLYQNSLGRDWSEKYDDSSDRLTIMECF